MFWKALSEGFHLSPFWIFSKNCTSVKNAFKRDATTTAARFYKQDFLRVSLPLHQPPMNVGTAGHIPLLLLVFKPCSACSDVWSFRPLFWHNLPWLWLARYCDPAVGILCCRRQTYKTECNPMESSVSLRLAPVMEPPWEFTHLVLASICNGTVMSSQLG